MFQWFFILLVGGVAAGWCAPGRVEAQSAETPAARIARVLNQRTSMDFEKAPLAAVMESLSRATNVTFWLDRQAIVNVGLAADTQVTVHLHRAKLADALTSMLRELDLTWKNGGELVVVTTPEEVEAELPTAIFDVRDLVVPRKRRANNALRSIEALTLLLPTLVAPESWDQVGGPGAITSFRSQLIVCQTDEIHAQLSEVLQELRRVQRGESKLPDEFERTMRRVVSLPVAAQPLTEFAKLLQPETKLDVTIDTKALDDVGLPAEVPVSGELGKAPLRNDLRALLKTLELTCVRVGDAIQITTPEEEESQLTTQFYNVRELLPATNDNAQEIAAYRSLLDELTHDVFPETWSDVGGPGDAKPFDRILVVSHTQEVQEQVEAWLQTKIDARRNALPSASLPRGSDEQVARAKPASLAPRRLDLSAPPVAPYISCDFRDTPLTDVLRFFERPSRMPIVLDEDAFDDVGLSPRVGVSLKVRNLSWRTAREFALHELDLTWYRRDGKLHVTTPEVCEMTTIETHTYAVGDLVAGPNRAEDERLFVDLVASLVAPETWEGVGGNGSATLEHNELTVVQTQENHRQIARLIDGLRNALLAPR